MTNSLQKQGFKNPAYKDIEVIGKLSRLDHEIDSKKIINGKNSNLRTLRSNKKLFKKVKFEDPLV